MYGFIVNQSVSLKEDVNHKVWCDIIKGDIFEYGRFYTKHGVPLFLKYKVWNTIMKEKIERCGFSFKTNNTNLITNLNTETITNTDNTSSNSNASFNTITNIEIINNTDNNKNTNTDNKNLNSSTDKNTNGGGNVFMENAMQNVSLKRRITEYTHNGVTVSINKDGNRYNADLEKINTLNNNCIIHNTSEQPKSTDTKDNNPFFITQTEYDQLCTAPSNYEHQIHVDVQRTFRSHSMFHDQYSEGQYKLFKILVAYANYNPQIGYCQGMSSIVALALMHLPELNTFNTINFIIKYNNLETLFDDKLSKLSLILELQHTVLEQCVPKIYKKIVGVADLSIFIYSWYLTLFSRFDIALSLRIFDLMMFYDFSVLLVVVPSILRAFKKRIYECDGEGLIRLLTTMENESVDVDKVIKYFREYMGIIDIDEYRNKLGIVYN